jgi:nitrite reductase/ring-hydroxylating ferredoxin subunit
MKLPKEVQERLVREAVDRLAQNAAPLAPNSIAVSAERYIDRAFFDREMKAVFEKEPIFVGLSSEAPECGGYFTREMPGASVLVVRGKDGRLRAFRNRCRHRGARVAEGAGSARRFVCRYHAWTYGLDGRLVALPDASCFEQIKRNEDGLEELPLIEWAGLLFMLPAGLDEEAARRRLQRPMREIEAIGFENYRVEHVKVSRKPTNWKLGIDVFMEAYHVPVLHAQSVGRTIICNFVLFEDLDGHSRLVALRRPFQELDVDQLIEAPLNQNAIVVYVLFPNTVIVSMEQHSEIHRFDPVPGAPNRMLWTLWIASSPVGRDRNVDWNYILDIASGVIEREDLLMMIGVQANLNDEGPKSTITFGRNEPALHAFHAELDRVMGHPLGDVRHE